jgi:hypothetical protein
VTERPSLLPYLHQPQPATRCFPARYRPSTRVSPPGRLECRFPGYGLSASGARSTGALNCTPSKEKSLSELRVRKVCFPGIRGRLLAERHVAEVMDTFDIALRLSAASIVGAVLGLNRDLHGKPTGVRTLGVLCLGSALAVLSIHAVTGLRRQSCDPRRRDGRRFSGRGCHCPKRETSSRARAHDRGLRLGDRVHGCRLRDRAVADRGDRRCSHPRHSCVRRAFRKSGRSTLVGSTDGGCGSAARYARVASYCRQSRLS